MFNAAAVHRVEELLTRNSLVDLTLTPPSIASMRQKAQSIGGAPAVVIITCSDPRVNPEEFIGLKRGEAAVIRNAGGRASDAMRSIHVLNAVVPTGVIMVVHHTDCGMTAVPDEEVRDLLKSIAPTECQQIDKMAFGEIKNVHVSIKEDVAFIKSSSLLSKEVVVKGYCLDIENGRLTEIEC